MKIGIERCQSPLEIALGEAFSSLSKFEPRVDGAHEWEIGRWTGWWLALLAQPEYGKYRCDFGISSYLGIDVESPPFIIVIEVDGHDFHEKTREQVEHDKRRDRYMTSTGARVFRFSGREVYRDALGCAEEVLSSVFELQGGNINTYWELTIKELASRKAAGQA